MNNCGYGNGIGAAIILVLFILLIIIVGAFIQSFKNFIGGVPWDVVVKGTLRIIVIITMEGSDYKIVHS